MLRKALHVLFASSVALGGCASTTPAPTTPAASDAAAPATTPATSAATTSAAPRPAAALEDPSAGLTTFYVFESYLSPQQQPGEETDAPKVLEKLTGLQNTATPTPREQRKSLGHGQIRFNKNLSRAIVDVEIKGVNPADIVMFHVHCGPPGVLGPIIVNFGEFGDLSKTFVNGRFSAELSNKNITYVKDMPGLKPSIPESCPAELGFLPTQAMTIAGLEYLARKGVLYFNLHTKAHTFYGEMRGQIHTVKE
jgi:hypothetical protein